MSRHFHQGRGVSMTARYSDFCFLFFFSNYFSEGVKGPIVGSKKT